MREAERGSGWGERQGEAAQDDKAREDTGSGAPTGVCLSRGSPRPCLHPFHLHLIYPVQLDTMVTGSLEK